MSAPEGYAYDFGGRVLTYCLACGATVHHTEGHDAWHQSLSNVLMQISAALIALEKEVQK